MNISEPSSQFPLAHVWEDLVNDFLEMACFLTESERGYLLGELMAQGAKADAIYVHPSFSLDKCIVVICEERREIEELWLYEPRDKKIRKMKAT